MLELAKSDAQDYDAEFMHNGVNIAKQNQTIMNLFIVADKEWVVNQREGYVGVSDNGNYIQSYKQKYEKDNKKINSETGDNQPSS